MDREDIIEAILESLPKPIVAVDENNIIFYMNRAARAQHTDLTGRALSDCSSAESASEIHRIAGSLEAGLESITLRGQNGFIRSYFIAIHDYQGRFAGYYEMMS